MRDRRPELDGLRAFAVAAVVALHVAPNTMRGGFLGVDVFFVLSGFLITESLLDDRDGAGRLRVRAFYARRVRRIWPALAAMLLTVATVTLIVGPPYVQKLRQVLLAAASLTNWYVASGLERGGILTHTWSLSLEEQFYLLWPALLAVLLRLPSRHAAVAVVAGAIVAVAAWRLALALGGAEPVRTYVGLDTRADALLIGCALALVGVETVPERLVRALAPIAVAVLVAVFVRLEWKAPQMAMGGFTVVAVCAAVLVAAAHRPGRIGRLLLGNRLALWVGVRSYGIYLWHAPVLLWTYKRLGATPALAFLALSVSLALAALSYRWIERPFLRRRDEPRPTAGAPAPVRPTR